MATALGRSRVGVVGRRLQLLHVSKRMADNNRWQVMAPLASAVRDHDTDGLIDDSHGNGGSPIRLLLRIQSRRASAA
jgi:hypothetical protein